MKLLILLKYYIIWISYFQFLYSFTGYYLSPVVLFDQHNTRRSSLTIIETYFPKRRIVITGLEDLNLIGFIYLRILGIFSSTNFLHFNYLHTRRYNKNKIMSIILLNLCYYLTLIQLLKIVFVNYMWVIILIFVKI